MNFYMDIETTGFNPKVDKVVSIQFQELDNRCNPKKPLVILKEWESSEKAILEDIHDRLLSENVWFFIPIGFNLLFDLTFLFERFKIYGLDVPFSLSDFLYKKPIIDLKYSLIIANNLEFKNSGLDKMTNKETDGRNIPIFYNNKEYDKIESYIKQETESFIECLQKVQINLKELFKK
ncbi:MAG TPA: ribonuclease H-like domain-containing protein [Candidatus Lokiarchaeia archaeon]